MLDLAPPHYLLNEATETTPVFSTGWRPSLEVQPACRATHSKHLRQLGSSSARFSTLNTLLPSGLCVIHSALGRTHDDAPRRRRCAPSLSPRATPSRFSEPARGMWGRCGARAGQRQGARSACGLVSMKPERQSKENLRRRTSTTPPPRKGPSWTFFHSGMPRIR